jgi:hypothetical protein
MARSGQNDPNTPSTTIDDSAFMRMGHTSGPYGNNPNVDARGEFAEDAKDLRP